MSPMNKTDKPPVGNATLRLDDLASMTTITTTEGLTESAPHHDLRKAPQLPSVSRAKLRALLTEALLLLEDCDVPSLDDTV
jgi:hypothetical protein